VTTIIGLFLNPNTCGKLVFFLTLPLVIILDEKPIQPSWVIRKFLSQHWYIEQQQSQVLKDRLLDEVSKWSTKLCTIPVIDGNIYSVEIKIPSERLKN